MRFMHISDLHIGKRLKERSLIEDQEYILEQIMRIAEEQNIDAMLIAGDVFDDGNSTTIEAVNLLDDFLTDVSGKGIAIYMISGNHDSMDRLEFGSRLFRKNDVFIGSTFKGSPERFELNRNGETVDIYLMPFTKPVHIREFYPDIENDYDDALKAVFSDVELKKDRKNILVTHQYVVSGSQLPEICDSERKFIGGEEAVGSNIFDGFDYVALGHIHSPQSIGRETVRYCGAPLKYTGSENETDKTVTIIDVGDDVTITEIPLVPKRDIRIIKGPLDKLIECGRANPEGKDDYIFAIIDDEEMDAMARLREVYPNTLSIAVKNEKVDDMEFDLVADLEEIDMMKEFEKFFKEKMDGQEMTESQKKIIKDLMSSTGAI